MKIALAQINPTIGAFKQNCEKICSFIDRAVEEKADLIVFPELSITGYPPRDLLDRPGFITDNIKSLEIVRKYSKNISVIIGFIDLNTDRRGKHLYNAAAVINKGVIQSIHSKSLLPSYDVFDEHRYFEPVRTISLANIHGIKFGVTICEDIWAPDEVCERPIYHVNPVEDLIKQGAEVIVNLSASPFNLGKINLRRNLVKTLSAKYEIPFLYVNQVGGNDDLVFDGNSIISNAKGEIIKHGASFKEDLLVFEINGKLCYALEKDINSEHKIVDNIENIYNALILGLRDYVKKCGFKQVVLGLSGGIDSAVVCALAAKALGPDNVVGVAMPSKYSSADSVNDAKNLANNLGVHYKEIPIHEIHDVYTKTFEVPFKDLASDATEENLQARIRGNIIMALSNKFGYLVLTTGNKSELSVGYCTLYGDMCGGLAVISDVPKMMVYSIAKYINLEKEIIPLNTITKEPSAELRPNQSDQDSLPPYPVLDEILRLYIEEAKTIDAIVKHGYEKELVRDIVKKINQNEYKRKQAAPGLRVTSKAFGTGRRVPTAQLYNED